MTCDLMIEICAISSIGHNSCEKVIGLCLTASHNPEEDNGIKISDPDGGVIDMKWWVISGCLQFLSNNCEDSVLFLPPREPYCNKLANATSEDVSTVLQEIVDKENIDITTVADSGLLFCVLMATKRQQNLYTHIEITHTLTIVRGGRVSNCLYCTRHTAIRCKAIGYLITHRKQKKMHCSTSFYKIILLQLQTFMLGHI